MLRHRDLHRRGRLAQRGAIAGYLIEQVARRAGVVFAVGHVAGAEAAGGAHCVAKGFELIDGALERADQKGGDGGAAT